MNIEKIKSLISKIPLDSKWILPVSALLLTLTINTQIRSYKKEIGLNMQSVEVVVAKTNLQQTSKLEANHLETDTVALKHLPNGAIQASDLEKIIGQQLNQTIHPQEIITWSMLTSSVFNTSNKIPNGYRSIAIEVESTSSVGYTIQASDRVDLIATLNMKNQTQTLTLLENITVLAVGDEINNEQGQAYNTITLLVKPKQANLITHALSHGKISIALRNPDDISVSDGPHVIRDKDLKKPSSRHNASRSKRKIEIIKGLKSFSN